MSEVKFSDVGAHLLSTINGLVLYLIITHLIIA